MATVAGQGTTFNLENFVGELFNLTPADTPFKNLASRNGIRRVQAKEFPWQTTDNAAPAQPAIVEGADPVYEERDRSQVSNVVQIFQYGVEISYTKLMATLQVAAAATPVLDEQPVTNELEFQQALKLDRCAEDMEVSFLSGVYANPADNTTGRKTRGIITAIVTNTVAAGAAAFATSMLDELLAEMSASRARFIQPVLFGGAFQVQAISAAYGFAPESRTVGGINIEQIVSPLTGSRLGVVYDRHMPAGTLLLADMAFVKPVVAPIPGRGELFLEPLAKTGAAEKSQLYGEWGIQYGPERFHGTITGLATS